MILSEINGMYDIYCIVCEELYFSTTEYNSIKVYDCLYPLCPKCHHREGVALGVSASYETLE